MGVHIAEHVVEDVGEHAIAHAGEDAVAHAAEHEAESEAEHAGAQAAEEGAVGGCAESFAASTLVAIPGGGEQPIASLKAGDQVLAYDPATGKASTQTVTATSIHHDDNLVDITLRVSGPAANSTTTTASATTAQAGKAATHAASATKVTATTSSSTHDEVVHTTTTHPWLTADHGWLPASFLRLGEPVQRADGTTAAVVAIQAVPGAAAMWDLTVSNVHTFAVGSGEYVVHNCGDVTRVRDAGPGNPQVDHAPDFDTAREHAFRSAGWTEDTADQWHPTKVDPVTGTEVEFRGPDGAKVAYDSPHADMDPDLGHDQPHISWQTGGKRGDPGWMRGNVTYDGPQHPFRSPIKGIGWLE